MDDSQIIELYWQRNEAALTETANKYGSYCFAIANNIVHNREDAQECVNDTYLGAWNAIPPHRPSILVAFLGTITRRISLNKWNENAAKKRGGGRVIASLDELGECIPDSLRIDEHLSEEELVHALDAFLATLPTRERMIFVRRYFYLDSIVSISQRFSFSQSKVKMTLKRTRDKLKLYLQKEGVWL